MRHEAWGMRWGEKKESAHCYSWMKLSLLNWGFLGLFEERFIINWFSCCCRCCRLKLWKRKRMNKHTSKAYISYQHTNNKSFPLIVFWLRLLLLSVLSSFPFFFPFLLILETSIKHRLVHIILNTPSIYRYDTIYIPRVRTYVTFKVYCHKTRPANPSILLFPRDKNYIYYSVYLPIPRLLIFSPA